MSDVSAAPTNEPPFVTRQPRVYRGADGDIERARRLMVEDIARLGRAGRRRTRRQIRDMEAREAEQTAQLAADPTLTGAPDALAELQQRYGILVGSQEQAARDSIQADNRSNNRLTRAYERYMKQLQASVPFRRAELNAWTNELLTLAEQQAGGGSGGGGGGGGGGGSRGGGSSDPSLTTTPGGVRIADLKQSIPEGMAARGFSPEMIEVAGQIAQNNQEIAQALDNGFALAVQTGGLTLGEVEYQAMEYARSQGLSPQAANLLVAAYVAKWSRNWQGPLPENPSPMYPQAYPIAFRPSLGASINMPGFGVPQQIPQGTNPAPAPAPAAPQQPAAPDFSGASPDYRQLGDQVGSGEYGETYFRGGVVWQGRIYSYARWATVLPSLRASATATAGNIAF